MIKTLLLQQINKNNYEEKHSYSSICTHDNHGERTDREKFVVCQVGGNWCPWCLRFADFISKDSDISKVISDNFIYIHVNYNPRKSGGEEQVKAAKTLMRRLGNPQRFGFPVC